MASSISVEKMTQILKEMGEKAVIASRSLAILSAEAKSRCLIRMAEAIEAETSAIKQANAKDLDSTKVSGLSSAMIDRLTLNDKRIAEMAEGLRVVAAQVDPVGKVLSQTTRPNGLTITKLSVPLGVIGIIYESRPNVTVDAAGICLKAGNAVILRGGSEAFNSNLALAKLLDAAAVRCGLPDGTVQLVPWVDRAAVPILLKMDRYIDLIIPRGGESLIHLVCSEATMPVLKHYKGVCHLYVDAQCDVNEAIAIVTNSKCQRPSACNALETLLINRKIAQAFIPPLLAAMKSHRVELRGDAEFCQFDPTAILATEADWHTEYLDLILSVKLVDSVEEAVEHINLYGSRHSDGIISAISANIDYFFANVDSATLYSNASTRFTDGGEFGMGAEIGISTDKLHARGPMGADELTSYKYLVRGDGQIRS
ncbi:MAG: glutamate-5-semialdehyde dehydrogenase [Victivallales bacterium]|nr:glutamate-5-semialdehyde dehydrogenase [Victivallales bacterium]